MDKSIPTRVGQICETINPLEDEKEGDVYIITNNPLLEGEDGMVEIVKLKDLQRNISSPSLATKTNTPKSNLLVVGEDISDYIKTWNN